MLHLLVSVVVFYTLHSVLADHALKRCAARRLGLTRWYRLLYSLVSVLLLTWVWWAYVQVAHQGVLVDVGAPVKAMAWSLLAGGALLATAGVLRFGGMGFLGLAEERSTGLVRTGMHGRVRHPIYTGVIMAALGWVLLAPTWKTLLVVGLTFLYLPIGIHLEERKLIALFGDGYRRYRREVPALLPRLWPRRARA